MNLKKKGGKSDPRLVMSIHVKKRTSSTKHRLSHQGDSLQAVTLPPSAKTLSTRTLLPGVGLQLQ